MLLLVRNWEVSQVPSSELIIQRRADRLAWEKENEAGLDALRELSAGHDVQQAGEAPRP